MDNRRRKTVYSLVEHEGRCWWRRLGVGFVNADGTIDVKLNELPQSGALQLRDAEPRVIALECGT